MRRSALLSLLIFAVTTAVAVPLAFASGDAHGPACSNITNGGTSKQDGFFSNGTGGTFNFSMTLAAPACPNVTYTFYVSFDGGAFSQIPGTPNGTLVTMPTQTFPNATSLDNVCVYATSTKSGDGDIADRAPDKGCLTYVLDSSPAGGSFN